MQKKKKRFQKKSDLGMKTCSVNVPSETQRETDSSHFQIQHWLNFSLIVKTSTRPKSSYAVYGAGHALTHIKVVIPWVKTDSAPLWGMWRDKPSGHDNQSSSQSVLTDRWNWQAACRDTLLLRDTGVCWMEIRRKVTTETGRKGGYSTSECVWQMDAAGQPRPPSGFVTV